MTIPSLMDKPALRAGSRVRLERAAPDLWRVIDRGAVIIGHVQAVRRRGGVRFRAQRYHAPSSAFRDVGEFWRADDAVDALLFSR